MLARERVTLPARQDRVMYASFPSSSGVLGNGRFPWGRLSSRRDTHG